MDRVQTLTFDIEPVDGVPPATLSAFTQSKASVLATFKRLLSTISSKSIRDYQILIKPAPALPTNFTLHVVHSGWDAPGPRPFPSCLSCHPDRATISENNYPEWLQKENLESLPDRLRRLTSGDCEITIPGQPELVRVWLDAQARAMVVVTPRRHTGGMDDMSDEEITSLWRAVGDVVSLWIQPNSPSGSPSFKRIVLNAGTFRNIEHAHVKVYFEAQDFTARMSRWPSQQLHLWQDLYELRRQIKRPNPAKVLSRFRPDSGSHKIFLEGKFVGDKEDLDEIMGRVASVDRNVKVEQIEVAGNGNSAVVTVSATAHQAAQLVLGLHLTKIGRLNLVCKVGPVY
ncbi:hypothetical protein HDU96_003273 [Phlyctochytrium bullatum]|nr:hypothetical protein HDU96_003273 [Phlyctochytrium bullatum]